MDALKFSDPDETTISGLAAPFDGPFDGKDLDREFFTKSTDFALDWYTEIPLLYHHGRDGVMQTTKVGMVTARTLTDEGIWAEAQLDKSNKYFAAIKALIKQGKLFFSSAAPPHLVQTNQKSGEVLRWPMYELSLTPTPANFLAAASVKSTDEEAIVVDNKPEVLPVVAEQKAPAEYGGYLVYQDVIDIMNSHKITQTSNGLSDERKAQIRMALNKFDATLDEVLAKKS